MSKHSEPVRPWVERGLLPPLAPSRQMKYVHSLIDDAYDDYFAGDGLERRSKPSGDLDLQGQLDEVLPARYRPNGVIVDSELEIVRFLGNTSLYIRPASGEPSMNLRRMASAELLPALRTAISLSKRSASAVCKEIAAPRSSGNPPRMRIEVVPLKASHLHKEYFLVLFEEAADIQGRKLSDQAAPRLAAITRDSNDAVIIRDPQDRIIAWNSGAQELYGYTEAEALKMSIGRLMPENKRIRARERVRASARGRRAASIETKRRTKDGRTLDVLLTLTVLRDESGDPVEVVSTERDITEQKRAAREFRRLHARVISAQETERRRLARELHDGVGQILSGVKYGLESLPGQMALSADGEAKIRQVGGFLERAISEIRRVSQNLMPSELVDLGLEPALLMLCRGFKERAGIAVTVRTDHVPTAVAPELALALFRITQEALNNIGKHAQATMISVALSRKGKELVLSVSDNGNGFKPGACRAPGRRGLGLGSMRERAESLGGSLDIHSTPGAGTTLKVHAPLAGLGGDAA